MGRPDRLPPDALIGIHVLVVDDDSDARELFRTVPDVLVTDIAMPERDGYWLIQQVRTLPHERGRNLPAIAVTAHGASQGAERAWRAGFQALLRKPLDPWDLCRQVSALAGRGDSGTPGASRV